MPKDYDFVSGLLDEVALEGLDGITLEMLWQRLRDRPSFAIPVDEDSKIFLWKIIAMHKDIEIYELCKPRKFYPIYNRYDYIDPEFGIVIEPEKLDPDPYAPVVSIKDGDVRGSCSTYNKRKYITSEIRRDKVLLVSLKEAEDTWGDSLVLVASPKVRLLSLIGTVTNPLIDLSLEAYCLLERIGRSRYLGEVTQGEGGLLSLKAPFCKQLHYYKKKLTLKGLITKQSHYMKNKKGTTCSGSLFHLTRFYVQRKTKMANWMKCLCDILKDKPQNRETCKVLKEEMKIPHRTFRKLFYKPFEKWVKLVSVTFQEFYPDGTQKEWFSVNGQPKYVKLCQLLRHCDEEDDDKDDEESNDKAEILPNNIHFDSSKIYLGIPLVHQLYGHIKKSGPEGLSSRDLGRTMTLPRLDIRNLLTHLSRKGHIISILQDRGRQKVQKYIAKIYANQNTEYSSLKNQDILSKKPVQVNGECVNHSSGKCKGSDSEGADNEAPPTKRIRIDQENDEISVQASETANQNGGPKVCQVDSNYQNIVSQVLELQNEFHFTGKAPKVVSFSESLSVPPPYAGTTQLTSRKLKRSNMILEYLKSERLTTLSDLQKHIMEKEKQEGYSFKLDKKSAARLVYSLHNNKKIKIFKGVIKLDDEKTEIEFICNKSLGKSDPLIQVAIEQAKFRYFGVSKQTSNKTSHANKQESSSSVPISSSAASANKSVTGKEKSAQKPATKPPAEVITKYPRMTPKFLKAKALHSFLFYLAYKHKGHPGNNKEQVIYNDTLNWRRFVPPLLEQIGEGWVYLSDIYSRMPLSLFVKIVQFNHGFPGLNQYMDNEEKSHYLIKFLPQNLRNSLMNNRKYLFSTNEVIKILCYLGLVTIGPSAGKQKDQLFLYVHKHASIKDTTISPSGYMHIKKDIHYEVKSYAFVTEDDIENFWLDLENITFHTSLGKLTAAAGKTIRITEAAYKPELISAAKSKQFNEVEDDGSIPGDGLGAGGFDSSLYLHFRRNWRNTGISQPPTKSQKPYSKRDAAFVSIQNLLKHNDIPSTETRTRLQRLTKNALLTLKNNKVAVNKSSDNKKVLVSAGKFRSKRERTKVRTVILPHTKKRTPYYDLKDKAAIMKMNKKRCTWTSQEDSFLLLCKVASFFLDPHYCKNLVVPYAVVRDLLYKQVPELSENKTSRACQRRLRYMMMNSETLNNVNVFLGEALQDDELVKEFNVPKPPKTNEVWVSMFTTVLKKLLEKFTSSESERCKYFVLPSSREELEKHYELKNYYKTNRNYKDLYKAPKSVEDIRKFVLSSLILSAMAVTDDTAWSYLLHKLYQCFPDNYISSTVTSLRKAGVLAVKKRTYRTDIKRSLQSSCPYKFSVYYSNAMLTKFPVKIFKEAECLLNKLKSLKLGADEELIGDIPPGFAAAVLSLMQTNRLYIETRIPSQIILFDSSLTKEARSNIVERMINTLSDKESTELSILLNDVSIPSTAVKKKEHKAKIQLTEVCETINDYMSFTDDLSVMDNSQMSEVQRFASASRFALYLLRHEMSQAPKENVQHAQDYIVLNSCSVVCHLESTSDMPNLPIIPVDIIENTSDQYTLKTSKEAVCITEDKMLLTSGKIAEISQQLVQFIPSNIFLPNQNYVNQIEVMYKNYTSNVLLDAKRIFDYIYLSGEFGITEKEIWKTFRVLSGDITVFEHLDIFRKSDLIVRAGIVEFNYVCGCFAKNYLLPIFLSVHLPTKSKKNNVGCPGVSDSVSENTNTSVLMCSETYFQSNDIQSTEADKSICTDGTADDEEQQSSNVSRNSLPSSTKTETLYFIPRTWRNPDGSLNKPTFFSLLSTVLSHIISMPGISSCQVCEQFSVTLPSVETLELIEILEKAYCVYKYYCKPLNKKSLFSKQRTISVTKNPEPEDVDHIEPYPDAVCKIADLRGAMG